MYPPTITSIFVCYVFYVVYDGPPSGSLRAHTRWYIMLSFDFVVYVCDLLHFVVTNSFVFCKKKITCFTLNDADVMIRLVLWLHT